MPTSIKIENVSKQYRLGVVGTGTLSHDLKRWWTTSILGKEDPYLKIGETNDRSTKGSSEYVWALKDINLEIEQGDVVGIIGKNGAGKSTLLKLLSRVTKPTTGSIKYNGRIASLLEVGTGFHPEMTGRENIYMNGAIMGMTRAEITAKLDEIISFAGIERYIDTPTKRYSSGMTVRLGFSIAAHLEPDILVVDEVLAVGDAEFQKKAIGKMQDVSKGGGRTVLFVSHNMASVMELCKHAIILKDGQVSSIGNVGPIVSEYINSFRSEKITKNLTEIQTRLGNGNIQFNSIKFLNDENKEQDLVQCGQKLRILLNLKVKKLADYEKLHVSVKVIDANDNPFFHMSNSIANAQEFRISKETKEFDVEFILEKLSLNQGEYFIHLFISDLVEEFDVLNYCAKLKVVEGNFYQGRLPESRLSPYLVEYSTAIITT
jgi:lipopolysaccharide transport system ATP-binding protein